MCVWFRISSLENDLELLPPSTSCWVPNLEPPEARQILLAGLHNFTRRQKAAPASTHIEMGYKPFGLLRAYVSLQKGSKSAEIARQKG